MDLAFSHYIEKNLNNSKNANKTYGQLTSKIMFVLSILQGADTLADVPNVPPTRRHKLGSNYKGCWAIDLNKNWRIIIQPNQDVEDLSKITSVTIIDIVDYH